MDEASGRATRADETWQSAFAGARVLVTGGLGFIGSRLALRLADYGARLTILDNMAPDTGCNAYHAELLAARATIRTADIRDEVAVTSVLRNQDYLFNMAALISHMDSMRQPHEDLDVNARAQLTILDACRAVNPTVRIVHASTRQVYGRAESLPVTEMHRIRPPDVNGINKLAGELYYSLYEHVYGIRTTVLRLTNVFGPGMRIRDGRQTFMGLWFRALLQNTSFDVWGGDQVRDLLFVDDAVDAFCAAACNTSAVRLFNVGGIESLSLHALAKMMIAVNGGGRYEVIAYPDDRRPIEIGDFVTDSRMLTATLGWVPRTTIAEGVRQTLDYYAANMARYTP